MTIAPAPPRASFALPWDDPTVVDPVGASYINVRERSDAPAYTGYEHFGVSFPTAQDLKDAWERANGDVGDVTLEPIAESADGFVTFRLRYLLPLTVEAQYFPA